MNADKQDSFSIIVNGIKYHVHATLTNEPKETGLNGGRISKLIVEKIKNVPDGSVYTIRPIIYYDKEWITLAPAPGSEAEMILNTALAGLQIYEEDKKE